MAVIQRETSKEIDTEGLIKKIDSVLFVGGSTSSTSTASTTSSTHRWLTRKLLDSRRAISLENANLILDYVLAMKDEGKVIAANTKLRIISSLYLMLEWCIKNRYSNDNSNSRGAKPTNNNNINFKSLSRDDVKAYLDSIEKSQTEDPERSWIGSYNLRLADIAKFYRWLYYPSFGPKERIEKSKVRPPQQIRGLLLKHRSKISRYNPEDLWTPEEHLIFLKYCPHPKIKAYHAMAMETSARPHELLSLRIKDLNKEMIIPYSPHTSHSTTSNTDGEATPASAASSAEAGATAAGAAGWYYTITVHGKTGKRTLLLTESLGYLQDWLDKHHRQRSNRDAYLFSKYDGLSGRPISTHSLFMLYTKTYRKKVFPKLLENPDIPQQDKRIIEGMLNQRRWNPYNIRHYSITKNCTRLSSSVLKKHAGWSSDSKMPAVYEHLTENASVKELLKQKGIIPKEEQDDLILQEKMKGKRCDNCGYLNAPDVTSCFSCKAILDYKVLQEMLKKKEEAESARDKEIESMKQELQEFKQLIPDVKQVREIIPAINEFDKLIAGLKQELNSFKELKNKSTTTATSPTATTTTTTNETAEEAAAAKADNSRRLIKIAGKAAYTAATTAIRKNNNNRKLKVLYNSNNNK